MGKRKKKSTSTTDSSRSTVGGLRLKPSGSDATNSKRLKTEQTTKKNALDSSASTNSISSPFWTKLPAELRNIIYEMAYDATSTVKVLPKRPRSSAQKLHKSILNPLIVSKQWFDEAVIIFVRSTEFQFANFNDVILASSRLAPYMEKNIVSISFEQQLFFPGLHPLTSRLFNFYPNLERLQIIVHDGLVWTRGNLVTERDLLLIYGNMLKPLLAVRGLKEFSWVAEDARGFGNGPNSPLVAGRSVYDRNWDTFSEMVRKEVTKVVGT